MPGPRLLLLLLVIGPLAAKAPSDWTWSIEANAEPSWFPNLLVVSNDLSKYLTYRKTVAGTTLGGRSLVSTPLDLYDEAERKLDTIRPPVYTNQDAEIGGGLRVRASSPGGFSLFAGLLLRGGGGTQNSLSRWLFKDDSPSNAYVAAMRVSLRDDQSLFAAGLEIGGSWAPTNLSFFGIRPEFGFGLSGGRVFQYLAKARLLVEISEGTASAAFSDPRSASLTLSRTLAIDETRERKFTGWTGRVALTAGFLFPLGKDWNARLLGGLGIALLSWDAAAETVSATAAEFPPSGSTYADANGNAVSFLENKVAASTASLARTTFLGLTPLLSFSLSRAL